MSLSVDGVWKTGVWAQTVWASGVWYESTPAVEAPQPFYRLVRKGKPKRYLTPQKDLERFAQQAFSKKAETQIATPSLPLDINVNEYTPPPVYEGFEDELLELSAALETKVVAVEKKIIKKVYDDDEDLLSFL